MLIAQFELGKYLRQLDSTYHHPDYCVDFLVRILDGGQHHQMVLEYDGFEFHFEKGVPSRNDQLVDLAILSHGR